MRTSLNGRIVSMLAGPVLAVISGCGSGGSSAVAENAATTQTTMAAAGTSGDQVQNHVHGAVLGVGPNVVLLGTHFGLRLSPDAGTTWSSVPATGGGMVAAIVSVPAGFAAAVMPMAAAGASGSGAMAGGSGGSMTMSGKSHLMYSADGRQWTPAAGLPADASISNLAAAPSGSVDWASVTGKGIYRSADAGRTWVMAVPTNALITALYDAGSTLVVGTPDGLGVTSPTRPVMPTSMTLASSVNALTRWWTCPTCLAATLASGGIATSRDGGQTWQSVPAKQVFDNIASFGSTGAALFGMVAAPTESDKGAWRSTDAGHTWSQVLAQPQVDYMFEVPSTPSGSGTLLAFQWGIVEWRSTDGGVTWSQRARL